MKSNRFITQYKDTQNSDYPAILVLILIWLIIFPSLAFSQGDLLITPRRIIFEGNKQRQEITLANIGQDSAIYSISFVQYRMTDNGSFEQIEEPDEGQFFADPYLRFFPRSVTLAPNESQVVRMQLRKLPGMVDGEYRSHLYFRAVQEEKPLGAEDSLSDTTAIGIRLVPIFGITIPVIIRVGDLHSVANLTNVALNNRDDSAPELSLTISREGNKSVYGDLTVDYVSPKGEVTGVGVVRGIAVYTPNKFRKFSMLLQKPDGVDWGTGKLRIRYSSSNEAKPEIFAETDFVL